jgi:hypothetical protein
MPSFLSLRKFAVALVLTCAGILAFAADSQPHVVVPEEVAALIRPILDLRAESIAECGEPGTPTAPTCLKGKGYERDQTRWRNVEEGLAKLIAREGTTEDEALVVLLCYYTGESGDNEDAVINRGSRELPYLLKYRKSDPVIPKRAYSGSLRFGHEVKEENFQIVINAIKNGETRD